MQLHHYLCALSLIYTYIYIKQTYYYLMLTLQALLALLSFPSHHHVATSYATFHNSAFNYLIIKFPIFLLKNYVYIYILSVLINKVSIKFKYNQLIKYLFFHFNNYSTTLPIITLHVRTIIMKIEEANIPHRSSA